ncbi:hypothetical protein [Enterococcus phage PEF1]
MSALKLLYRRFESCLPYKIWFVYTGFDSRGVRSPDLNIWLCSCRGDCNTERNPLVGFHISPS